MVASNAKLNFVFWQTGMTGWEDSTTNVWTIRAKLFSTILDNWAQARSRGLVKLLLDLDFSKFSATFRISSYLQPCPGKFCGRVYLDSCCSGFDSADVGFVVVSIAAVLVHGTT
jgi:hypothetical protein